MKGDEKPGTLLSIGELARLTSVPVKTIRHYSDLGVLPPRQVTRSRYRLYHQEDRFRLEVIRLLRSLDFDLETIRALLARHRPARETMRLQLDAVDAGLRRLRRTRAVLARALENDTEGDVLDSLRRLHAIAVLDSAERGALLRGEMEGHLRGVPIDQAWQAQLWDAAFARLPDELDDEQWRALFELTELVQDEDFGRKVAEQARGFWTRVKGGDFKAWEAATEELVAPAAAAADAAEPVDGPRARELLERFLELSAGPLGKPPGPAHRRWMRAQAARHDPRAERFWQLVARVRGLPMTPPPRARAFQWLFAALRAQKP